MMEGSPGEALLANATATPEEAAPTEAMPYACTASAHSILLQGVQGVQGMQGESVAARSGAASSAPARAVGTCMTRVRQWLEQELAPQAMPVLTLGQRELRGCGYSSSTSMLVVLSAESGPARLPRVTDGPRVLSRAICGSQSTIGSYGSPR